MNVYIKQLVGKAQTSAIFLLLFLFLIIPYLANAQTTCGNFVEIDDAGVRTEYPITDCSNPFGVVNDNPNLVTTFNTTIIEEAGRYPLLNVLGTISIIGSSAFDATAVLYLKDGADYIIKKRISRFRGGYTFDETGTYIFVITEQIDAPQLSNTGNFFFRFLSSITPKAIAFGDQPSKIITFTVTDAPTEPEGLSNILFLPGIQASRLYSKDEGSEDKLWEPGGNRDVRRLAMNSSGNSIENVYTKDVIDELPITGRNIYKGFLSFLNNIDDPSGGPMVKTFPYDWRRSVFDIVKDGTLMSDGSYKNPTAELESLANVSPTGKVTIIAHSNGGLLAKAIMVELEKLGKTDLVDKIIFIATPQLGTPKGIAAILHGYDQSLGFGFLVKAETVRDVMVNMQGAYSLLPSQKYLDSLSTPLISFDGSSSTKIFRDAYGFAITNINEYKGFLRGDEGRGDAGDKLNEPSKVSPVMLDSSLEDHSNILDSWTAPPSTQIFNIVGTGRATPKSIEYKEYPNVKCLNINACVSFPKIEATIKFTKRGDKTVLLETTESSVGFSKFVDVLSEKVSHAKITESDAVQSVVNNILNGSSTDAVEFVSDTEPAFSDIGLEITSIHSPARIYIRDSVGNISGRATEGGSFLEEIEGSSYLEIAGVKYVIVPSNIDYEVFIEGEGTGIYTLNIETLSGDDNQELIHEMTASVTPEMVATYSKSGGEFSNIFIDEDGDGVIDSETTIDGDVIEIVSPYDELNQFIKSLSLSKWQEDYMLKLSNKAEWFSDNKDKNKRYKKYEKGILRLINRSARWYKKRGIITKSEYKELRQIIKQIIKK